MALVACGKDEAPPTTSNNSNNSETNNSGTNGSGSNGSGLGGGEFCANYQDKLTECGILGEGTFSCLEPTTLGDQCVLQCVDEANCTDLDETFCLGAVSAALVACIDACVQPFVCSYDDSQIQSEWLCDGIDDCLDGEDEIGCDYFTCDDGISIHVSFECDGFEDCLDASDEVDCPIFTCGQEAIPAQWECDGEPDCTDGSDEHSECAPVLCD